MSVGKICSRTTHLAGLEESASVAASRMKEQNVGTLLVVDDNRRPIGIVTDRDLALRVVGPGLDPRATMVGQVMTARPRSAQEQTPIEDAVATMRSLGVRRLPVVDEDERLVGIVSLDDVLELVTEELNNLGRIVALSRPAPEAPAAEAPRAKRRRRASAGLERASSDLEC
jgi:CBS domain-containing protein